MASADLELCYLTATEAIDQFKAKKLSPLELMKAVLARCAAVNPKLNVLTYTFAERALEHAKASEARYVKGEARPLEGVPLAIKDFHPVRGEITTFGSLVYKGFRPDNTAPTIERLFDAGAIMALPHYDARVRSLGRDEESPVGYLAQPLEP
jgi:amidase